MGLPHISTRVYNKRKSAFELFRDIGFQKTHCFDNLITDSAAGGTAMATGHKSFRNAIGVDADTNSVNSILYHAHQNHLKTGIVTNSSIVHATPASFFAHQPFRALSEPIAKDLVDANIDFIIGGGQKFFDKRRTDRMSLLPALQAKGYELYDYGDYTVDNFPIHSKKKIIFFSASGEPSMPGLGQEYLTTATKKAINYLDRDNTSGFVLMIEGAQIDWAGHGRDEEAMLVRMEYFDDMLKNLIKFVQADGQTLLVVTADHSTGELGFLDNSRVGDFDVKFNSNDHTASMVPVFAMGPGSERFKGIYENTQLFYKMMSLMKWDRKIN